MKTNDGVWTLETYRQAEDTTARKWIGDPVHFKKEKPNLLDALKPGDRVMFRVEYHRKLNGTEKDVFIPKADDPNKEEKFIGSFLPAVVPSVPQKPTDNVKAMCDSGKLTPELQARYCQQQTQAQNQVGSENTGSFFPGQGSSQGSTTTREDPGPQVAGDGSIGVSSDENPKVRHDGVSISRIAPGGPANRAGIQAGDVILAIDDHYLFTAEELTQEIRGRKPGTRVAIRYRRHATIYDTYLIIGHADSKQ
jgi:membrane-associated protease RseP (regulator of RpoE activity)